MSYGRVLGSHLSHSIRSEHAYPLARPDDDNDREGTVSSLAQDKMQALELWKVSAEIVQLEN